MLKYKVAFLLLSLVPFLAEAMPQRNYYAKIGAVIPPGDVIALPNVGLGARFIKEKYSLDLSVSLGSLIFFNYASVKGVFLYHKKSLYMGVGPGLGYYESSVPMGGPFGAATTSSKMLNIEGVVGYQFRKGHRVKPFVQLELSQPTLCFGSASTHRPGLALSSGLAF